MAGSSPTVDSKGQRSVTSKNGKNFRRINITEDILTVAGLQACCRTWADTAKLLYKAAENYYVLTRPVDSLKYRKSF